ncbi:hypothetical protein [Marinobacter sp. CA1]|uniref:hypothetical protein n=1 Tax=Marinobacter sp. CA1 TaxID=2817656 RepID=UPI001D067262|nr:hypothetical protein [Marinobacter sp. CA1]UDL05461.1 hypothetical protein J2887_01410 [Marinobacter sp. CA1]
MRLPQEAEETLRSNIKFCFSSEFVVTEEDAKWFQENLGLADSRSAFVAFYTIVAFPPVGNGPELLTLESILENSAEDIQELPEGLGTRFIRLTSFEGEGAYYFDVKTDKIYDVAWGQEADLSSGQLSPLEESFFDFLARYYKKT